MQHFPLMLLDSIYVTTDPSEATHFYVWVWLYYSDKKNIASILADVKAAGPWWDKNQGKDHIFIVSHDLGLCDSSHGPDRSLFNHYLSKSIVMEHWGRPTGITADNPCWIFDAWPTGCDQIFQMVEGEKRKEKGVSVPLPCYTKGKDLVVPTITSESPETSRYMNPDLASGNQTTLILFGGGINQTHLTDPSRPESDAGYSFGVRQTFARLYENHPDIKIFFKMVPDYWRQMHGSIFCLAPAGWGWGARVKSAITRGCIPVIIQDGIKVEWEDELPYHHFAIRVPFMYIHRLPEILRKYQRLGRVPILQKNLACVWRLFWWNRPHGRAFEMTICSLKARMMGSKPEVDFKSCTITCGDGRQIDFNKDPNTFVM